MEIILIVMEILNKLNDNNNSYLENVNKKYIRLSCYYKYTIDRKYKL